MSVGIDILVLGVMYVGVCSRFVVGCCEQVMWQFFDLMMNEADYIVHFALIFVLMTWFCLNFRLSCQFVPIS